MSFAPPRKSQGPQNRSNVRTQSGARGRKPSVGAPSNKGVRRSDPLANALVNYTASNARSRGGAGGVMNSSQLNNAPSATSSNAPFSFLNGPPAQDKHGVDADSPPHFFYQGGEFVNSAAPPPPPNRRGNSVGPRDQQGTARLTRAQQLRQAYNENRFDNNRTNASGSPGTSHGVRDTTPPPLPPQQGRRPSNRDLNGQAPPASSMGGGAPGQGQSCAPKNRSRINQEYNGNGAMEPTADKHANAALAEVKNPYIRSVLQGQETRWVPPSLAAEQQNPRTRSQSLTQYSSYHQHRELAPYLSRQHLFEAWKENMRAGSQLPYREGSRDGSRTQQGRRLSGSSQHSPNPQDAGDIVDNTDWDVPDRDGGERDRRGRRSVSEGTAAQYPGASGFGESQHRIFPLTNPHLTQKQEESLRDPRVRAGGRVRDGDVYDDEGARRAKRRDDRSNSRRRRTSSRRRSSKRRSRPNKANSRDGRRPRHSRDTNRGKTNGRRHEAWGSSESPSDRSRKSWALSSDSSSTSVSSHDRHRSRRPKDREPPVRSIGDALRKQQRGITAQRRRQEEASRSRERIERTRSHTPDQKRDASEDRRAYLYSSERKAAPHRRRGANDAVEAASDRSSSSHDKAAVYPPHHHSSHLFSGMNGGYTTNPLFNNEFNRSRSSHSPAARPPKDSGFIISPNKPNPHGVTGSLLSLERFPRQFYFTQPEPMVQPNAGGGSQVVVTAPSHMEIRALKGDERDRQRVHREHSARARLRAAPFSSSDGEEEDASREHFGSDDAEEPRIENALLSRGTVLVTTKKLRNSSHKGRRSASSKRNGRKGHSDEGSDVENYDKKKKKHHKKKDHKKRDHSKGKLTHSEPHKRYTDKLAMFFGTIDQPSEFSPLQRVHDQEETDQSRAIAERLQLQPFEEEYMHDIDAHDDALAAVNAAPIVSFSFSNSVPVQPTAAAAAPIASHTRYPAHAQPAATEHSAISFTSPPTLDYSRNSEPFCAENHAQAQAAFWRRKELIANSSSINASNATEATHAEQQTRNRSASTSTFSASTNAASAPSQQQQPSMLDKVWSRRQGKTVDTSATNGSRQQEESQSARSQAGEEPKELTFTCPHCRASHQKGAKCSKCGNAISVPQPCGRCGVVGRGVFCSHCGSQKAAR